ncbi:type II secretory ATPase GspE/PulE/Tfp pilus assembly ATPase PilB-like protein [Variovorax sp. GrIS 2.14]
MQVEKSSSAGAAALESPADESAQASGFTWPNPVAPGFAPNAVINDAPACEFFGANNQRVVGKLTRFLPKEEAVHVQLNQSSRATTVRFNQFRMLRLTRPLSIGTAAGTAKWSSFKITWNDGSVLEGESLGQRKTAPGLFLFVAGEDKNSVVRLFVPRSSFKEVLLSEPDASAPDAPAEPSLSLQPLDVEPAEDQASGAASPDRESESVLSAEVVTPEQLVAQLEAQSRMPMVRIGQALISLGLITEEQLRDGLAQQQFDRTVPLGETLIRMGVIKRLDLQTALARKMGYPLVNLQLFTPAAEALRKISHGAARRLQVMPLMVNEGRLIVALDDPANRHAAIDEAEFIAGIKVVPVLGQYADLNAILFKAYEKIGATEVGPASADLDRPIEFDITGTNELLETLEKEGQPSSDEDAPIEQSDNSLVRMINRMILEAHREGVSDIHIESYPGREKIRIRFRRDGRLYTYLELPPNYRNALIARIKIMCDLDISEKRKPQDGKINFSKFSPQHRLELRVATVPTNNGLEDVVMRLLASAKPIALDALGLSERNLAQLKAAIERPYGMVLCVGPTGSGKTTTLHSALMHINTPERKIWTAEDPIEITQVGLRQVQINPRIDWTFAKALRAFVRADPDVIMVGEIRDEETAKTAIEASLTGHLVLSTLHTNSAPETVTRLLDMGMDPFNFADSLLAVLAQRLVRRLCTHCVTSRPATGAEVDELLSDYMHSFGATEMAAEHETVRSGWLTRSARDGALQMYQSVGCKQCGDTGFKGRVGIHELMVMSRPLRRLVQNGARAEELQETAMREGMRTLRQDGIDKVLAGQTTIDEVRATSNV